MMISACSSHVGLGSDFFTALANIGEDRVDTLFVNDSHTLGRDFQADESIFAVNPETMHMQVGCKTASCPVIRMADVVSRTEKKRRVYTRATHLGQVRNQPDRLYWPPSQCLIRVYNKPRSASETSEPRPIIKWSSTRTSICNNSFFRLLVSSMSLADGSGTPEG